MQVILPFHFIFCVGFFSCKFHWNPILNPFTILPFAIRMFIYEISRKNAHLFMHRHLRPQFFHCQGMNYSIVRADRTPNTKHRKPRSLLIVVFTVYSLHDMCIKQKIKKNKNKMKFSSELERLFCYFGIKKEEEEEEERQERRSNERTSEWINLKK